MGGTWDGWTSDTGPRDLRAWPSESGLADGCHQLSAVGLTVKRALSASRLHHARPDARYAAVEDVPRRATDPVSVRPPAPLGVRKLAGRTP